MVSTAKQGQFYSNTQNSSGKGSRDGWKILQSKKAHPTPTKDSRTVTPGTIPVEFLSFTISCPWQLTPQFWEEHCALFLVSLTDQFWVLFAIQILQKTLQQPHSTDPGTTPLFVCCTTFWTKRLHLHMPKDTGLITDFLIFFFLFFKSFGLSKANISHKSLVVAFSACARGEQISKYF